MQLFRAPAILLLVLLALALTRARAQVMPSVTVKEKNVSVIVIFNSIQKQTGYNFFYNDQWLKTTRKVSVDAVKVPLKQVLDSVFKDQPLTYSIIGQSIVVKPKEGSGHTQPVQPAVNEINVKVQVVNSKGEALQAAAVQVENSQTGELADEHGVAALTGISPQSKLVITSIGYESQTVAVEGRVTITVTLKESVNKLGDIVVEPLSTGYQYVPKERATGSFVQVDNELLNRRVSTNVLDRLEGVASGVLFPNRNIPLNSNEPAVSIRGRSTIFANATPLIVLDNFPYDGDISNINPNSVESITILKDAAAASIWGARSGNGVIVITTKKGSLNQQLHVDVNANLTIAGKPDLYYSPNFLKAADYIDMEQYLFDKGYYDGDLSNTTTRPAVSPVVEILAKQRAGLLSDNEAKSQIDAFRNIDARNDLKKYLYRNSANQQYAINLNGGSRNATYFLGLGYDNNVNNLVYNGNKRYSVNAYNTYTPVKNLDFSSGFIYTQTEWNNNNPGPSVATNYPYTRLVDALGNPVAIESGIRKSFTDTAGGGKLLDWHYYPLREIALNDNTTKVFDVRFTPSLRYTITRGVNIELKYQYEKSIGNNQFYHSPDSWYARNQVNLFTQINGSVITRPVPSAGILNYTNTELTGQGLRAQLNLNRTFAAKHAVAAIAGIESREVIQESNSGQTFGYNRDVLSSVPVDLVTRFPTFQNLSGTRTIAQPATNFKTTDEYFSYFANGAYTYNGRYTLTLSGRIDQSNLFGVQTNQKSVPLWSAGAGWKVSSETFYHVRWLPYLKLRTTYGYNGNVDKTASALLVAQYSIIANPAGLPYATIRNPPNGDLRWEKDRIVNIGADFEIINKILTGSVEYYEKKGTDLIGNAPLPPSSGFPSYKGNIAALTGKGVDADITANILQGGFKWASTLLFSYNTDRVTSYSLLQPNSSLAIYGSGLNSSDIYPVAGRPLYALYSFRWAGLDPATGDPQGYLDGKLSKDYASIVNNTDNSQLVYNGPARPVIFGAWRNTISYRNLSLSVNITYKLGYYFFRPSVNYGNPGGNKDYSNRWQKPGDEKATNVPSFVYPDDQYRDIFYDQSQVLVEKGDHIRLQDIQFSYSLSKERLRHLLPATQLQFYMYVNNLGILWRANKAGLDPDYLPTYNAGVMPQPKSVAIGIKASF